MQPALAAPARVAVISVLTAALKQAMLDYEKLNLGLVVRNELHVYTDYGTLVFPGANGHVEIHDTLHEGEDKFVIADRQHFFKLVKLMNGMYTTLTYLPQHERLSIACNGMRFTTFAYAVDTPLNVGGYITTTHLDADIVARLRKALPFVITDLTRPTLEHVFYDRTLGIVGSSDGHQLYIDNDRHVAKSVNEDVTWVSRYLLKQAQPGDVIELGDGFECLLHKHGVYTFDQRMDSNAFGFKNMRSVHRIGWQYTRFVVRAKQLLGPLQRYKSVTSKFDAPLYLAVNATHAVLLQPPTSSDDNKRYVNYIAVEQPPDLAGRNIWTMPEDTIDDLGKKVPSQVEPPADRYAVSLNADFLARALRVLGGDVVIAQKNPVSPIVLVNEQNPHVWCNIMPLHVTGAVSSNTSAAAAAWRILDAEVAHGDF